MMIESYVSLQEYIEIIKIMRFENKMSWKFLDGMMESWLVCTFSILPTYVK